MQSSKGCWAGEDQAAEAQAGAETQRGASAGTVAVLARRIGKSGMNWLARAHSEGRLVAGAYLTVLLLVFLTNTRELPNIAFVALVIPLATCLLLRIHKIAHDGETLRISVSIWKERAEQLKSVAHSRIFQACALYLLVLSASSWTHDGAAAAQQHIMLSAGILLFVLITALFVVSSDRIATRFLVFTVVIVASSALFNMISFALETPVPPNIGDYRLVPSLGTVQHQGATTISLTYALYAVAAISLAASGLPKLQKALVVVCGAVLLWAVLWTQSRGAYLGLAAGMTVLACSTSRTIRIGIGAAIAVAAACVVAIPTLRDALLSRGGSYRPELWHKYLQMAAEHPFFGYGPLSSINVAMNDGTVILHPHNILLSAQIRGGILAACAMIVILAGGLFWTARYWRKGHSVALLCAFVTMITACMVDYELVATPVGWPWVTFWMPIAFSVGAETVARRMPGFPPMS